MIILGGFKLPRQNAKNLRHQTLKKLINDNPFITDFDLAKELSVSVPTIRLDRRELGIKEYKERVTSIAKENAEKISTIEAKEIIGHIISINPGVDGIAFFEPEDYMVFEKNKVVRGQYVYAFAESTAISIIDKQAALVGVANIKYRKPVYANSKLFAFAEVKKIRGLNYFVWVIIKEGNEQVFRGKFILKAI